MAEYLDNPETVTWSHSNRQSDYYELPTDGAEMHEALGWLLQHYDSVKLWMGAENDYGTELYIHCTPSKPAITENLKVVDHDLIDLIQAAKQVKAGA